LGGLAQRLSPPRLACSTSRAAILQDAIASQWINRLKLGLTHLVAAKPWRPPVLYRQFTPRMRVWARTVIDLNRDFAAIVDFFAVDW